MNFATSLESERPKLRSFCRKLVTTREDAEDLTQTVMVKAWAARSTFGEGRQMRNWLRGIAKRASMDLARYNSCRVNAISVEGYDEGDLWDVLPDPIGSEDEIIDGLEQAEEIAYARARVSTLSNRMADVMGLYLDGFSYPEIAEELEMPIGTVRSTVFRAKKILIGV